MRRAPLILSATLAACVSGPTPDAVSHDVSLYKADYAFPAEWPALRAASGEPVAGAYVAKRIGDRQLVLADSTTSMAGGPEAFKSSVIVFGSQCGLDTATAVVRLKPLGAIGHDAGVGLHAAGTRCVRMGQEAGIPVATVSGDTAYVGVVMSIWTTGKLSTVNDAAAALGVRVGMSAQQAAELMLANVPAD